MFACCAAKVRATFLRPSEKDYNKQEINDPTIHVTFLLRFRTVKVCAVADRPFVCACLHPHLLSRLTDV